MNAGRRTSASGGGEAPDRTRIVQEGACSIIYDAAAAGEARAHWFDPAWWESQGQAAPADTGRGTTWFVGAPGAQWVLRHYWRGGRVARWIADHHLWLGLERTRPFAEFRLTQRARALGLPVPRPIAARVLRAGLVYTGDLITERLPAVPCSSLMVKRALDASGWSAAGACVARCHGAGLDHADLTWNNVLLDGDGTAHLIDLDRAVLRAPGRWADANLARLKRSLIKLTPDWTAAERDAAWREFMAGYSAG